MKKARQTKSKFNVMLSVILEEQVPEDKPVNENCYNDDDRIVFHL